MQQSASIHASPATSIDTLTTAIRGTTENVPTPNDGVAVDISNLCDSLKQLALNPIEYRFYGKSSSVMLVETALELKQEYTQSVEPVVLGSNDKFWAPQEVRWPRGVFFFR